MGFTSLGLSAPILKAIEEKGYTTPSPIQEQAIPAVLTGNDIMAAAQTGTGKTAGFTLPILELLAKGPSVRSNQVRALILTPTRELAAQIQENVETYSRHLKLSNTVIFGGVKANPQMQRMRRGADVLVATPGRLLDLFNQNAIKFDQLEVLVLDEADRMLDMGFIHDIRKILRVLPKKRQNLLFSATFSDSIRELAKSLVNNPVEISVAKANSTATLVDQQVYTADVKKRAPMLLKLINDGNWHQVLVFTSTKRGANRLSEYLTENGVMAAAIHGNKSQGARTKALANFKSKEIRVLVATDIAARGIDIPQLPQVVNFDLPNVAEDYVHRIGRTGRAGEVGKAISFVTATDIAELSAIERLIKKVLPRFELEGYPATNKVPETKLDTRPIKPKKPKKPRVQSGSGDAKPAAGGEARRGDAPAKRRSNGSNGYKGKSGSAAKSTGGESRSNGNAKPAGGQRRRKPQPKPATSNS